MTKKCRNCGFDNVDDAEFCESCGSKLASTDLSAKPIQLQSQQSVTPPASPAGVTITGESGTRQAVPISAQAKCPYCGTLNDQGAEFCENCGAKLAGAAVSKPVAKFVLPTGEEILIITLPRVYGRSDFVRAEKSEYISRKHFEISFENNSFYILDVGSTNGTLVNGVKISSRTEIKDGDTINPAGVIPLTFRVLGANEA